MTQKELRSKLYDALYQEGENLLRQLNPCNIHSKDGQMVCNGNLENCCYGCKHLTKSGCKVQALSCKLWLCNDVRVKPENKTVVVALEALRRTGSALRLDTWDYRKSKEELGL